MISNENLKNETSQRTSKDVLQKIAIASDDREALLILTNDSRLDNDKYFQIVFGTKYPDLIKYKVRRLKGGYEKIQSLKRFYLIMLNEIAYMKEKYGYVYISGNPQVQLKLLQSNSKPDNLLVDAIRENSIEMVKEAVRRGADIHLRGEIPMKLVIRTNRFEIFKYLLSLGGFDNEWLLRYAIRVGNGDIIQYLIDKEVSL